MKILMLSPEGDSFGGVIDYLKILKSKFDANIKVTDFTIGYRKRNKNALTNLLQPLQDGCRLFFHMMKNRYDIVHVNPSLQLKSVLRDGFFLVILKLLREDKVIVFFHGWDSSLFHRIKQNQIFSLAFRNAFSCRKILVLAVEFRDNLVELGFNRDNIEVVTTMFDGDLFAHTTKERDPDRFQILFLSRMIVEKGMYELLDAFTELMPSNQRLHLVMAGDGPEFETLKAKVEDRNLQKRIHLPGYIRNKMKADVMVSTDLFILPSYSEGCPVSLLEAMAAGLPIISSRVGAIPEIVANSMNGTIIDPVSKEEIVKALSYYIENPGVLDSIRENNRKIAWERYESSLVTKQMEKLYEAVAYE